MRWARGGSPNNCHALELDHLLCTPSSVLSDPLNAAILSMRNRDLRLLQKLATVPTAVKEESDTSGLPVS